jgi:hypothetical protein
MDPASVNSNNISINGVNGSIYSWRSTSADNRTFSLAPDNGLFSLDTVTIRLQGTLKDSYGRCLDLNKNGKSDDCDSSISWQVYIYPLGDYNGDLIVDGDDVADFTYVWNTQDISKEIGPATGRPPHLRPAPDGKVDFEDLVIFVWMWNWFHQQPHSSPPFSGENEYGTYANLFELIPDGIAEGGADQQFSLLLNSSSQAVTVSVSLEYDPAKLQIETADEKYGLSQNGGGTLLLKSINNVRGLAEIACSKLGAALYEPSKPKTLARIALTSVGNSGQESFVVRYKVWDSHARPLFSDQTAMTLKGILPSPKGFDLQQNFPNPFNSGCDIGYALPVDCDVTLTIYNISGQKTRLLVREHQNAGYKLVTWDGRDDFGHEVASGVYLYRIQACQFVQFRKMLLVK